MDNKKALEVLMDAKEVLKDVPSKNWITDLFSDSHDCCCAIGHYQRLKSDNPNDYRIDNCADNFHDTTKNHGLRGASRIAMECLNISGHDITSINNQSDVTGNYHTYTQKRVKTRVMKFLDDAIKCLKG